jgi:hypothetical protein
MEYYLVAITHVLGIMHYVLLDDIVALCRILPKAKRIVLFDLIVMVLITIV